MKFIAMIMALFALSACATTQGDTSYIPLLKTGQCVAVDGEEKPETTLLDVGDRYYVFSVPSILPPAGLGIPIDRIDTQLEEGNINVVKCYSAQEIEEQL